eukprot:scaffold17150_cov102-Isochrysis_galbana.AAC.1
MFATVHAAGSSLLGLFTSLCKCSPPRAREVGAVRVREGGHRRWEGLHRHGRCSRLDGGLHRLERLLELLHPLSKRHSLAHGAVGRQREHLDLVGNLRSRQPAGDGDPERHEEALPLEAERLAHALDRRLPLRLKVGAGSVWQLARLVRRHQRGTDGAQVTAELGGGGRAEGLAERIGEYVPHQRRRVVDQLDLFSHHLGGGRSEGRVSVLRHPGRGKVRPDELRPLRLGKGAEVLPVDPVELLDVEDCRRLCDTVDGEGGHQLVDGIDLLGTGGGVGEGLCDAVKGEGGQKIIVTRNKRRSSFLVTKSRERGASGQGAQAAAGASECEGTCFGEMSSTTEARHAAPDEGCFGPRHLVRRIVPAEQAQVVEHGLRQVSLLLELRDRGCAMPLGQLGPIFAQHEGEVGEARQRKAERLQDEHLPAGGGAGGEVTWAGKGG